TAGDLAKVRGQSRGLDSELKANAIIRRCADGIGLNLSQLLWDFRGTIVGKASCRTHGGGNGFSLDQHRCWNCSVVPGGETSSHIRERSRNSRAVLLVQFAPENRNQAGWLCALRWYGSWHRVPEHLSADKAASQERRF